MDRNKISYSQKSPQFSERTESAREGEGRRSLNFQGVRRRNSRRQQSLKRVPLKIDSQLQLTANERGSLPLPQPLQEENNNRSEYGSDLCSNERFLSSSENRAGKKKFLIVEKIRPRKRFFQALFSLLPK